MPATIGPGRVGMTDYPWPWRRHLTDDERNILRDLAHEGDDD